MGVACAGSEHDDLGKPVKADNAEVVTGVDEIRVDVDNLGFPFGEVVSDCLFKKSEGCLFLPWHSVASEYWDIWVLTKSSNKHLSSHQKISDQVVDGITHTEDTNSVKVDVVPLKLGDPGECDLMLSTKVGHMRVGEAYSHDDVGVVAYVVLSVAEVEGEREGGVGVFSHLYAVLLEAGVVP